MISALHLLWIIPVSGWFGYAMCAVFTVAKASDYKSSELKKYKNNNIKEEENNL